MQQPHPQSNQCQCDGEHEEDDFQDGLQSAGGEQSAHAKDKEQNEAGHGPAQSP